MPMTRPRTAGVCRMNWKPSQMALAVDGTEIFPSALRLGISRMK